MTIFSSKRFVMKLQIVLLFLLGNLAVFGGVSEIDPSFNPQLTRDLTTDIFGNLVMQPDGKIIIFGRYNPNPPATGATSFARRLNQDGTTDNTFNCGVCLTFSINAAVVQPDGKIIFGGSTSSIPGPISTMVRVNADGSRDNSFVPPSFNGTVERLVQQPDGKILFKLHASSQGVSQDSLRRLNSDGTIDDAFNTILLPPGRNYQNIENVLLLPDGKILLGGGTIGIGSNAWLQRYIADGTADGTFTPPSFSDTDIRTYVLSLSLLPDGGYLVAGDFKSVNAVSRTNLVKLQPAGNVDLNFTAPLGVNDNVGRVKVLPDGKFITPVSNPIGGSNSFVRFNPDGSIDNTYTQTPLLSLGLNWTIDSLGRVVFFGSTGGFSRYMRLNPDGTVDATFNPVIRVQGTIAAIAVQSDGKIIVGGEFDKTDGAVSSRIARLNPDGSLDATFNTGTGFNGTPKIISLQPDGKILVGGDFFMFNGVTRSKVARLNADGSLDASFSVTLSPDVFALEPLANGKILIGGNFSTINNLMRGKLALLNADGSVDTSFNPFVGGDVYDVLVLADGKIMVAGAFAAVGGFTRPNLVRLNANGTLDQSFNAGEVPAVFQLQRQPDGKYLLLHQTTVSRVGADGSPDDTFNPPTVSGALKTIFLQADGSVVLGGLFTSVNNISRSNIARVSSTGTLDQTFLPVGASNEVETIVGQTDGKILVGGDFSTIENVVRAGIARINAGAFTRQTNFDYDGDGKADISVFRPTTNRWYQILSSSSQVAELTFGTSGDLIVPADYDGDGKTDLGIFRPSTGDWWYLSSLNNAQVSVHWGAAGDIPRPSDVDGDGRADFVLYRPSEGRWYRLRSSDGQMSNISFGIAEDKPVVGDFDGDGKADPAIFRPSTGVWWYLSSLSSAQIAVHWGISTDIPVAADYDGDGKTDFTVYRPSTGVWYILNSADGSFAVNQFGLAEDKPASADYDGDGRADIAVFRPSTGIWYLLQSSAGFGALQFGLGTDVPTPHAFVP